jgi:hypothetical protein
MKTIILFASVIIASGILLVNLYTSLIDVKSWGSDVPNSIAAAREYYKIVNPGNFFRIFSPVNQILSLLVLILFWKASPAVRMCFGAAFVLYLLGDVLTFAYFYPRNDIMFKTARLTDIDLLKRTVSEWYLMNWIRSAIILTGIIFSFLALHKVYTLHWK